MKLNIKAFSISFGVVSAIFILIIGLWYCFTGFGSQIIELLSSFYAGIIKFEYNPLFSVWKNLSGNILSVLILCVFSAIDAFIFGLGLGFFYNMLLPKDK